MMPNTLRGAVSNGCGARATDRAVGGSAKGSSGLAAGAGMTGEVVDRAVASDFAVRAGSPVSAWGAGAGVAGPSSCGADWMSDFDLAATSCA